MSGSYIKILFYVLFLVCTAILPFNVSFAGIPRADSLHRELFRTDDVIKKIELYLAISKVYETANPDSAEIFWKEAQNLAWRLKSEKPLADVYAQAAFYALKKNQLDQAFLNFTLAAKYYRNSNDQVLYARMKSMMGSICLVRDNIAEAMTYYMEVIDLSEKLQLYKILPHVLNNVGNIYMDSDDFNTALGYFIRALQLFRKIGDTVNVAYPLLNLSECYFYLGNLDMAKDYARQSIEVANKAKDNIMESRGLMIHGMIQSKQLDLPGAITMLNKSLELQRKHASIHPGPPNIQYSELLARLGDTWYQMGDMHKALIYNLEGYSVARSMKQVRQIMVSAQQLSQVHEHRSRLDSALFYYKIFMAQADSLAKSGNIKAVKLMEVRQEYEKKRQDDELSMAMAKSSKRTILIVYIASGIVLLAVILILFLMLKLEKQKKQKFEIEKQGLNEKLDFQNKELTTNVMYLTRMNELVLVLAEKLKKMDLANDSENARIIKSIIGELERASNPDNWKDFEVRFQQVHTDFYKKLGDQFPDLTPNELKLCAFLRLNMSTKEISAITYQSQNSLMVARSRLRQKLGISKDENLVIFLSQL
ncbi:MAG: tetratricopeptide repeat protein [Bacteroidetes bacterium]|nr:tetratricopeptide repeat protein [Bacteroidota bacterium]